MKVAPGRCLPVMVGLRPTMTAAVRNIASPRGGLGRDERTKADTRSVAGEGSCHSLRRTSLRPDPHPGCCATRPWSALRRPSPGGER